MEARAADCWADNQYVVEELCIYLTERDLCSLRATCKSWRRALNINPVWFRIVDRRGLLNSSLISKYDKCPCMEGSLEPLCYWSGFLQYTGTVRGNWRGRGGVRTTKLTIPECAKSCQVTCFDVDADLLGLGIENGMLVVFDLASECSQAIKTIKNRKVEKLYVRHSKIVLIQFGLIQVYSVYPGLKLMYCKTLENPDLRLLFGDGLTDGPAADPYQIPPLTRQQMIGRYQPEEEVDISKMDVTVSTVGEERLILAKAGQTSVHMYRLDTGEHLEPIKFEEDEKILKIGLAHIPGKENYLYAVVADFAGNISGIMFHIKHKTRVWKIYFHTLFNYNHSVYSVFTHRGLLLFGRTYSDSYPYTWLWRHWTYQGEEEYSREFETEYDMYLSDCLKDAVVTPRTMTYLYSGHSTIVFSQRTHRGVATLAYSWGCISHKASSGGGPSDQTSSGVGASDRTSSGGGTRGRGGATDPTSKLWKISTMSESCALRSDSNVPVTGSEVGQAVVIAQSRSTISIRDLRTGRRLQDLEIGGKLTNLWSDELRILCFNRDLSTQQPLTIFSFQ